MTTVVIILDLRDKDVWALFAADGDQNNGVDDYV